MSVFQVPPREGITEEEKQILVNDIANAVVTAIAALTPAPEPTVVEPIQEVITPTTTVESAPVEATVEQPAVEEPTVTE